MDDLVRGLIDLMESDDQLVGPINLGIQHELTIGQLATHIVDTIGSKSKVVFKDLPMDDPKQRRPDTTKAKSLLGWEPQVSFEEGINNTIQYFASKSDLTNKGGSKS